MIKNERQYRITQARAEEFRRGIAQLGQEHRASKLHPKLQHAQSDALRSQLQAFERELREYDELKSGRQKTLKYGSFDELPKAGAGTNRPRVDTEGSGGPARVG